MITAKTSAASAYAPQLQQTTAPVQGGAAPENSGSTYAGIGSKPPTLPTSGFRLKAEQPAYKPADPAAIAATRAAIPAPHRPLPASPRLDHPASTLGGKLDVLATPGDIRLTGLPMMMQQATRIVGVFGDMVQATGPLGASVQTVLAGAASAFIANPAAKGAITTLAPVAGFGLGVIANILGPELTSSLVREGANFISSEKGGASLAHPAALSMAHQNGAGWKGALDGLLASDNGMNWYSAFLLGNLRNRTGGGTGPQFYKELVVDSWDQSPGGRSFLASVGDSAVARPNAARWYAEYYYDVLDQEDGSGVATKVVDTLDYRFGLDARNMNVIYDNGAARWGAYERANPAISADLAGSVAIIQENSGAAAGSAPTPYAQNAAAAPAGAAPQALTGPQISGVTSATRAYRNGAPLPALLKNLTDGAVGGGMAAVGGPIVSLVGALFGKDGMGKVTDQFFRQTFSDGGGLMLQSLLNGVKMAPGGDAALTSLLEGVLTSSAGTAFTITSMEEFTQNIAGVTFYSKALEPMQRKNAAGVSVLDTVLQHAPADAVLSHNLRAIVDELDDSASGGNAVRLLGLDGYSAAIKKAVPTAAPYAFTETGPDLSSAGGMKNLLANPLADNQPLFDSTGAMTKFARVGLRLYGHDVLDGKVDGDVVMRTLLNPKGSGNSDLGANSDMVKKWGQMDLADDGVINGSVYKTLNAQILSTTGMDGAAALRPVHLAPASSDDAVWRQDTLQVFDFATQKISTAAFDSVAASNGLSANDLGDLILWGHVAPSLSGDATQQAATFDSKIALLLTPGVNDPTFTNLFARQAPGLSAHYQNWIGDFSGFTKHIVEVMNKIGAKSV